jgi:hypothetical protein
VKYKPPDCRVITTVPIHELEIKVLERRWNDVCVSNLLIEGKSESFICKFVRVITLVAAQCSYW